MERENQENPCYQCDLMMMMYMSLLVYTNSSNFRIMKAPMIPRDYVTDSHGNIIIIIMIMLQ